MPNRQEIITAVQISEDGHAAGAWLECLGQSTVVKYLAVPERMHGSQSVDLELLVIESALNQTPSHSAVTLYSGVNDGHIKLCTIQQQQRQRGLDVSFMHKKTTNIRIL